MTIKIVWELQNNVTGLIKFAKNTTGQVNVGLTRFEKEEGMKIL